MQFQINLSKQSLLSSFYFDKIKFQLFLLFITPPGQSPSGAFFLRPSFFFALQKKSPHREAEDFAQAEKWRSGGAVQKKGRKKKCYAKKEQSFLL